MATFKLQNNQDGGEKRSFTPIPEREILDVEVVKVEMRDKPDWAIRDPEVTQEVSFQVKVISGEYERRNLWGNAAPFFNYSPRCRLRLWVQGILGVDELPDGYELDLDELAGKRCRILVGNRDNKAGEKKDFIQDVFPAKKFDDAQAVFG
jgi:hypothetical protein